MNIQSIRYIMTRCVFYISDVLAMGYKAHNEFHNTLIGVKFYLKFLFSHELTLNEQETTLNKHFCRNIGTDDTVT